MTASTPLRSKPVKAPLSTRTLLSCVAIGIGASLLVVPANYLAIAAGAAFPPALIATCGAQILAAVIALRLLSRGGVGIFASAVVGIIGVFTSPQGWGCLSIVVFGALAELPFLIGRYRSWGTGRYVAVVIIGSVFYYGSTFLFFDLASMSTWIQIVSLVLPPLSMGLFCWLGALAADGLRRAGVGPKIRVAAEDEDHPDEDRGVRA